MTQKNISHQQVPQRLDHDTPKKILLLITSAAALVFLLIMLMTYFKQADEIITRNQEDYVTIDVVDQLLIRLLRLEAHMNDYVMTGDTEFLEVFDREITSIELVMQDIRQVWSGYLTRKDISAIKTDINTIKALLNKVMTESHTDAKSQSTLVELSKGLMEESRAELRETREVIVQRTEKNRQESLDQFSHIKWAMISLCAGSFALILLLFNMTLRYDKLNKYIASRLAEKNDQLEDEVQQRTTELMGLASYLTRLNEDEKKRIARELHDELGALLTAANMDAAWISRNLQPEEKARFASRLERLSGTLKKGIELKRQITDSLVPPLLRELGLIEALQDMISIDESINTQTNYQLNVSDNFPDLDPEQELALFRICQESLTNIKKYAQASEVFIRLDHQKDFIDMEISDNGVGFDMNNISGGTHGLVGMRSRAAMFDGSLDVQSSPDSGTRVKVQFKKEALA